MKELEHVSMDCDCKQSQILTAQNCPIVTVVYGDLMVIHSSQRHN
jgi:hypothetical protein